MIVVWGALTDEPVVRVLEALDDGVAEVVHIDDSAVAALVYDVEMAPAPAGSVDAGDLRIELGRIQGWYLRPRGPTSAQATVLLAVAGGLPAAVPVVNRPAAGRSNNSKPYQGVLLAAAGLSVPDTLVTSDPDAAREFLTRHRRVVYKSISGVRSVVSAVDHAEELDRIGHGPVQLQEWIDGLDVRVHVVGREWFATAVESDVTDYRFGGEVVMAQLEIPEQLGKLLVQVTAGMGLLVAGVDLRRTPDGGWRCFEINPSPGFTFYEDRTGQPIAAAIARLLRGFG
jgi:glutathione synthase/RimK-type ligase-like ATP-grasp enzyme